MKRGHPLWHLRKFRNEPRYSSSRIYDMAPSCDSRHPATDEYSESIRLASLQQFIQKNLKSPSGEKSERLRKIN